MAVVRRTGTIPQQAKPKETTGQQTTEPADAETAAVPTMPAHLWAFGVGLALVGGGLLAAWAIWANGPVNTFRATSEGSIFAGLVVVTAAVERVLEPFTRWLPGRTAQHRYDWALAAMENGAGTTAATAKAKADLEQAKADKGIIAWGLATGLATVMSASGGFYLLHMLAENPQWDAVPAWVDSLITGLIVGSGTKPVHDLISRVQQNKEKAQLV
ncbi:hypothetical protein HDA40_003147 [Hamadaea flava]|uniref:Uncharacterized protein n=1 Tax=Hamadaea flava TaxID=1742688 RepID=A0ABV8LWJ3_9ACTN|nr:hypothetical protein [Hamadaea flava]MCP2324640.1 hypothetical protein [Hamadaea flava]